MALDGPRPVPEAATLILPVWPMVRGALTVAATVGFLRLVDRIVPSEPAATNDPLHCPTCKQSW